jgi:hypothetical protein
MWTAAYYYGSSGGGSFPACGRVDGSVGPLPSKPRNYYFFLLFFLSFFLLLSFLPFLAMYITPPHDPGGSTNC